MKNTKQWFTSDPHFGHKNIIKFSNRPFKDINHMHESLIKSWNNVVGVDDEVYLLGDVSLTNPNETQKIINRLNGRIYLIHGNHEKSITKKQFNIDRFEWIKHYHELIIQEPKVKDEDKQKKQMIILCHYAFRVWNKSHHGSWNLYGHSHDSLDGHGKEWGRSMDVGMDSAYRILGEYRPFNYSEIKAIMEKREHNPVDHHVENRK